MRSTAENFIVNQEAGLLPDRNERPKVSQRATYSPRAAQEQFIVPLLKAAIETQIDRSLALRKSNTLFRVLDVGCGSQPFRQRIEQAGTLYRSLDVSPQDGVTLDFVARIDQEVLPEAAYQSGPYDLVLCSEVLEHVAEWDIAFANFRRLLAMSGSIILTCPHFFPLHEEPYDFWRPTPHAIRFFGEKHGLTVEKEYRLGTGWDVLGTLLARQRFQPRHDTIRSRMLSRLCNSLRGRLFVRLRSEFLQESVNDLSPYYLANCFVLRKDK